MHKKGVCSLLLVGFQGVTAQNLEVVSWAYYFIHKNQNLFLKLENISSNVFTNKSFHSGAKDLTLRFSQVTRI